MKRVSTPVRPRFICAICSSKSKSLTARRPLTMAGMSRSRQKSTSRPWCDSALTLPYAAQVSSIISIRSSTLNSPRLFGLISTATYTSS